MAYVNQLFPNPKLLHGLKRKIHWPTQIVSNGSSEFRINKQDAPRREWVWQPRAMTTADLNAIYDFLLARNMQLDSFKFYCPKEKAYYHVRLNQSSIDSILEAFDTSNNALVETMGDISLIEVFE
jgi:hypothetical protein